MITLNEEQIREHNEKLYRSARRRKFFGGIAGGLRSIIYTPLSIAFHAVSFVTRCIGGVASLGLIVAGYHLYKAFSAVAAGVPFADVDSFAKAIPFIVLPFAAYAISVVTDRIYQYFDNNSF